MFFQKLNLLNLLPPHLVLDQYHLLLPSHPCQVSYSSLRAIGGSLSWWIETEVFLIKSSPNDNSEAKTSPLRDMTVDWWYSGPHVDFLTCHSQLTETSFLTAAEGFQIIPFDFFCERKSSSFQNTIHVMRQKQVQRLSTATPNMDILTQHAVEFQKSFLPPLTSVCFSGKYFSPCLFSFLLPSTQGVSYPLHLWRQVVEFLQ